MRERTHGIWGNACSVQGNCDFEYYILIVRYKKFQHFAVQTLSPRLSCIILDGRCIPFFINLGSVKSISFFLIRSLFNYITLQVLQIPVMLSYWKEGWHRRKMVPWNLKEYSWNSTITLGKVWNLTKAPFQIYCED